MPKEASYEFDPADLDDAPGDTLDTWKPSYQKPAIVMSKWRQDKIGDNYNQEPGVDELNKIHAHLKKGVGDSDIMKIFGINAETMIAIKEGRYDLITGISLGNQSKIYKAFDKMNDEIEKIYRALTFISENLLPNDDVRALFKTSFDKPKKGSEKDSSGAVVKPRKSKTKVSN